MFAPGRRDDLARLWGRAFLPGAQRSRAWNFA